MKRVSHAGGRRPSFRKGQRRYSVAVCGVILYDHGASAFSQARLRRRYSSSPTCVKCRQKIATAKAYRAKRRREDRKKQLENYRARRKKENVMRARFGLDPIKYQPPPPSDYWSDR